MITFRNPFRRWELQLQGVDGEVQISNYLISIDVPIKNYINSLSRFHHVRSTKTGTVIYRKNLLAIRHSYHTLNKTLRGSVKDEFYFQEILQGRNQG